MSNNLKELKTLILESEPLYPENLNPLMVNLIKKCLVKDPKERITLPDIFTDSWVTSNGNDPLVQEDLSKCQTMDQIDFTGAITTIPTKIPKLDSIVLEDVKKRRKEENQPRDSSNKLASIMEKGEKLMEKEEEPIDLLGTQKIGKENGLAETEIQEPWESTNQNEETQKGVEITE